MDSIRNLFAQRGLYRSTEGRILGGVCAGIGRRFGLEPWPTRLLFVLALLVIPGSQVLVYPILWVLMPKAHPADANPTAQNFAPTTA